MLGLLMSAVIAGGPAVTYGDLMDMAINECPNAYWETVNEEILESLVEIEEHYFEKHAIPEDLRGMLLAAACIESGYNPLARGDWKRISKKKRVARARGIVQLWPWWSAKYKIDREDPEQAAKAWMDHIVKQRHKIERLHWCPRSFSDTRLWVVAWVQTARGRAFKSNRYRCHQKPSHYKLLKKWRKAIKKHQHSNACEC